MDQVIQEAATFCPMYNVSDWVQSVYNLTHMTKDGQLATLACQFADAMNLVERLSFWNGLAYVFGFIFGIPSAILAIITFYRSEFDTVSFFYHRIINIIELVYMGFVFEDGLEWMTGTLMTKSWAWTQFLTYFHYKLDQALPLAIQFIILWVAIERVTICFASGWFGQINRRPVAYVVIVASLVASMAIFMPTAFTTKFIYNNFTQTYMRTRTGFALTSGIDIYYNFLAILSFAQLALMTVATVATIVGLIKNSRRKQRLVISAGAKSANAQQLIKQISINKQLCLLQLCESIPVVVNCFLLVWIQCLSFNVDPSSLVNMPFDDAIYNISLLRRYLYLAYLQTVVDLAEHSTHFYRYYFFSNKVKATVRGIFKKNAVSQGSTFLT